MCPRLEPSWSQETLPITELNDQFTFTDSCGPGNRGIAFLVIGRRCCTRWSRHLYRLDDSLDRRVTVRDTPALGRRYPHYGDIHIYGAGATAAMEGCGVRPWRGDWDGHCGWVAGRWGLGRR